jgi:hypothetical protein
LVPSGRGKPCFHLQASTSLWLRRMRVGERTSGVIAFFIHGGVVMEVC